MEAQEEDDRTDGAEPEVGEAEAGAEAAEDAAEECIIEAGGEADVILAETRCRT